MKNDVCLMEGMETVMREYAVIVNRDGLSGAEVVPAAGRKVCSRRLTRNDLIKLLPALNTMLRGQPEAVAVIVEMIADGKPKILAAYLAGVWEVRDGMMELVFGPDQPVHVQNGETAA